MRIAAKTLRLVLAATLVPACSMVLAQDAAAPKEGHRMKEEAPQTGSNIKRDRFTGSALPFDKTYAELSAEEKRALKSRYLEMAEGDEPPFPVDGLAPLYKAISKANEIARGGFGRFEMEIHVDASGEATKVEVLQSPDAKLSQYAGKIAMLTKFKPALCKGTPCAMGFPVGINFIRR
jgi:hypothetical protein